MKYVIEVPDDMEYALLTGQTKTGYYSQSIEFAELEKPEPHWIPVTERLPEPRIDVWCNSDLGQMVGYYDEMIETWFGRDYLELLVNAWMPLPEPYKEVTE